MNSSKNGFSLLEALIVIGVGGGLILFFSQQMFSMKLHEKRVEHNLDKTQELAGLTQLFRNLGRYSKLEFDPVKSYYNENDVNLVDAARFRQGAISLSELEYKIETPDGEFSTVNSSHGLVLFLSGGNHGYIFSRCLSRARANETLGFSQAISLDLVPFIRQINNVDRVFCCPIGSNGKCSNEVVDSRSSHTIRSFSMNGGIFKNYPSKGSLDEIDGAGFAVYFDKPLHPTSINIISIIHAKSCRGQLAKECTQPFNLQSKITGAVLATEGIEDEGILRLN